MDRAARLSCEHSQSLKLTSTLCTAPLSACGGAAAGAAGAADDDGPAPFIIVPGGACATALPGRAPRMAVSSRHAFSWVNQSVRCSSLHGQKDTLQYECMQQTEGSAMPCFPFQATRECSCCAFALA